MHLLFSIQISCFVNVAKKWAMKSFSRLYFYRVSHFISVSRVFSLLSCFAFHKCFTSIFVKYMTKHETLTIRLSFFIQILCFVNAVKKMSYEILWHFAWMVTLAQNAAKHEESDAKYLAIHSLFFTFCDCFVLFRDKCIFCFTCYVWMPTLVQNTTKCKKKIDVEM